MSRKCIFLSREHWAVEIQCLLWSCFSTKNKTREHTPRRTKNIASSRDVDDSCVILNVWQIVGSVIPRVALGDKWLERKIK
jgi:hypothetical protein